MRFREALTSSNIRKSLRRVLEVADRHEFLRSALWFPRHLKYCFKEHALINEVRNEPNLVKAALGNRELVRQALLYPEFVTSALEFGNYVQCCLGYRSALEPFINARQNLEKMNVNEGSLYIDAERELLREAVLQANELPGPIVEIGTLYGYTTGWMAQWKKADKKIVTVDNYCWNPWGLSSESHKLFTARFLEYLVHRGEVEMVDMDKGAFYESYRGPAPSRGFLDADHGYEQTRKDIQWARSIGAKIISGHDYCDVFGVVRAVEEAGGRCAGAASLWVLNGSAWERRKEYSLPLAA
jgi:hypothetical protein